MFRPLTADEVECRVAQVGKSKRGTFAMFLIYKDARVDQKLLDEVVGPHNWKNDYAFINGSLYCTISIWDAEKKEWISKQNVGTESNTEATKGEASDAFKRAGFNWGIGRELYSSPRIIINLNEDEYEERNGTLRVKPSVKFFVSEMHCDEKTRVIDRLSISDNRGTIRYSYTATEKQPVPGSLEDAIDKAKKASNGAEVMAVWANFKAQYGNNEDFIAAIANNPNNPKKTQNNEQNAF